MSSEPEKYSTTSGLSLRISRFTTATARLPSPRCRTSRTWRTTTAVSAAPTPNATARPAAPGQAGPPASAHATPPATGNTSRYSNVRPCRPITNLGGASGMASSDRSMPRVTTGSRRRRSTYSARLECPARSRCRANSPPAKPTNQGLSAQPSRTSRSSSAVSRITKRSGCPTDTWDNERTT
jgi:hypothetical protein